MAIDIVSSSRSKEKDKKSNLLTFGVENVSQSEEIKEKRIVFVFKLWVVKIHLNQKN